MHAGVLQAAQAGRGVTLKRGPVGASVVRRNYVVHFELVNQVQDLVFVVVFVCALVLVL